LANGERPVITLTAKGDSIDTQEPAAQEARARPERSKASRSFQRHAV